jgi:hypothetical protein
MKTAQHRLWILTFLLLAGLFYIGTSIITIEFAKPDMRSNPNINYIFGGEIAWK